MMRMYPLFKSIGLVIFGITCMISSYAQTWQELNAEVDNYWDENWKKCEEILEKMEVIAKKNYDLTPKTDTTYYKTLNDLGLCKEKLCKFTESEVYYVKFSNIIKSLYDENHGDYALALNNLAGLYLHMGDYSRALLLYQQGATIYKQIFGEEHITYGNMLNNIANTYLILGRYSLAEPLFKQSMLIRKKTVGEQHAWYAQSLSNLSGLYKELGNYEAAEPLIVEAVQIRSKGEQKGSQGYLNSLNSLAVLYSETKRYAKAESLHLVNLQLRKAQLGAHFDVSVTCHNLAQVYRETKKYDLAESLSKESYQIRKQILGENHPDCLVALAMLATIATDKKNYVQAEKMFSECVEKLKKLIGARDPRYIAALVGCADLYRRTQQYSLAEPLFNELIQLKIEELETHFLGLSEKEKLLYTKNNGVFFNRFNQYVVEHHTNSTLQSAYNLQLNRKGALLNSTQKIKNRILFSQDTLLIKQYHQWQGIKNTIAKLENLSLAEQKKKKINLDSLKNVSNELEKELSRSSDAFKQTFNPKAVTYQEVQKKLKKGEVCIEIVQVPISEDSITYMFLCLTQKGIDLINIQNGKTLEKDYLVSYKRNIKNKLVDKDSYIRFWQPVASYLQTNHLKKVFLSPDGVYHQINLATLQNPNTNNYVIDEIDIQLMTNTKDILNTSQITPSQNNYLIGRPNYKILEQPNLNNIPDNRRTTVSFQQISDLPGTEVEINKIADILTKKNQSFRKLLGANALEDSIKNLHSPQLLHVATHGFFNASKNASNQDVLLRSGLLLAGVSDYHLNEQKPNGDDGILTAYEAMNLDLDQTLLVTLSACETGLGEIQAGEGVYGLQRAFKVAGAKNIIMSLWRVNDEATQELMTAFYTHWLQKKQNIRKAFIQAQLELRKKYPEPYYWGAFVMVGE